MGAHSCAVIEAMIINHLLTQKQLESNFSLAEKYFNSSTYNIEHVTKTFLKLQKEELLIPYKGPMIEFSSEEGIELAENKQEKVSPENEIYVLNLMKLYHLIRTIKFEKFLNSENGIGVASVSSSILQQSHLFGKCSVTKKTEKVKIKSIKDQLSHNTNLQNPSKAIRFLDDLAKNVITNNAYLIVDNQNEEISVNMEDLSNNIKINIIEDHILNNYSKNHVRVLRAISILKLKSLSSLDDMLLLNKSDLRMILYDLEKINIIKRIHFHENVESYEYHENIAEFILEFSSGLFKIIKNLNMVKSKIGRNEPSEQDEDSKLSTLKVESAIAAIAKNIFVLIEI